MRLRKALMFIIVVSIAGATIASLTFLPSLTQGWIQKDVRPLSLMVAIMGALMSVFAYLELRIFGAVSEKERSNVTTIKFAISAFLCAAGGALGALVVTFILLLVVETWVSGAKFGYVAIGVVFAVLLFILAMASAASFVYQRRVRGIADIQTAWRRGGRSVLEPPMLVVIFILKCAFVYGAMTLTAFALGIEDWFRSWGKAVTIVASVAVMLVGTLGSYFWMHRKPDEAPDVLDTIPIAVVMGSIYIYMTLGALVLCGLAWQYALRYFGVII